MVEILSTFNLSFGRTHLWISAMLRVLIVVAFTLALLDRSWLLVFISVVALASTFLPSVLRRNYRLSLPAELELLFLFFIYSTLILGEVHGFYTRFWWWDLVLHAGAGLTLGLAGFLILYTLYASDRLKMSPILLAFFSFSFALAFGVIWEIFEFSMDSILSTNMQKGGLVDTMWDLIVDATGAALIAAFGYLYVRRVRVGFFDRLTRRFLERNPHLWRYSGQKNLTGETENLDQASGKKLGGKSEEEWRRILSPAAYEVLRERGTEPPFTDPDLHRRRSGIFRCRGCGQPVFSSKAKFDSGTGWPSFSAAIPGGTDLRSDQSEAKNRVEVACKSCSSHLGHVFDDGPAPTGQRYCINSAALSFRPSEEGS